MTSSNWMGTQPTESFAVKNAPTILVGVGAGIAAYKVAFVVRALRKAGAEVHVIPTPRSREFVGFTTWRELSENPVEASVFGNEGPGHIRLAREADLILLAPATANMLARMRVGMADDLLTATVLASSAPVLACPAMHSQMWNSPATQENIATLKSRGWAILEPESGALSSGDTGVGRLPEPEVIADRALAMLGLPDNADLGASRGHVVITAGGTREPLDPVRFLGNRSTGAQGVALAQSALDAGFQVTLIQANVDSSRLESLRREHRLHVESAGSAQEMLDAVTQLLPETDILIMAAAVADFQAASVQSQKIKKIDGQDQATLTLAKTPDILATVSGSGERPKVLIGFGAETGDEYQVLNLGAEKAIRKGADLLAVNAVGTSIGFGDVDNKVTYFDAAGKIIGSAEGTKRDVATDLVGRAAELLTERTSAPIQGDGSGHGEQDVHKGYAAKTNTDKNASKGSTSD